MVFCSQCGTQGVGSFCSKCGEPLKKVTPAAPVHNAEPEFRQVKLHSVGSKTSSPSNSPKPGNSPSNSPKPGNSPSSSPKPISVRSSSNEVPPGYSAPGIVRVKEETKGFLSQFGIDLDKRKEKKERRNSDDPEKKKKQAEEKAQKKKAEAEKKEEEARKKEEEAKKKEDEARKKADELDRRKSEARLSVKQPAAGKEEQPRRNSTSKPLPPKPAPPKHPRGPDPEPEMEFLKVRLKSTASTANLSSSPAPNSSSSVKPLPAVPKAANNWGQWRRSQDPEASPKPVKDNSKTEPASSSSTSSHSSPASSKENQTGSPAKAAPGQRAFVAKRAESGTLTVKTKTEVVRAKPTTGFSRFNNKRAKVIEEIILTEADYVADLELIVQIYVEPLRANKLISEAEHATLFLNIEQLLQLQREFLKSLTKDEGGRQVVKAFLEAADYFKSYGVYCAGANPSRALCDQLKKRAQFQTFLDYCAAQPGVTLPFDAYLIKPVQRICKYPLLLRELIRETSDNSMDAKSLAQARDKIEAVVTTVNESTRAKELAAVLLELSHHIRKLPSGFVLLEAQRRLLAEGPVMMGPADGKLSRLYFFLLTDLLLVVKNKRKNYIYATHFMFTDAYARPSSEDVGEMLFPLRLTAGEEEFILGCSSVPDRDLLVSTFEKHNPAPPLEHPRPGSTGAPPASAFSQDDVWVEYKDSDGYPYYYHEESGRSLWTRPPVGTIKIGD